MITAQHPSTFIGWRVFFLSSTPLEVRRFTPPFVRGVAIIFGCPPVSPAPTEFGLRKVTAMNLTGKLKVTHTDSGATDFIWSHEDILSTLNYGWTIDPGQESEFARMYALCTPSDQLVIGNNLRR